MTTVDYESMTVDQLKATGERKIQSLPAEHRDEIKQLFDALVMRAQSASTSSRP